MWGREVAPTRERIGGEELAVRFVPLLEQAHFNEDYGHLEGVVQRSPRPLELAADVLQRLWRLGHNVTAGDLATWIRSILLHPDAVVPTFFKDGYVDWVFENHIATGGASFPSTFKIGTMLSLELMLQQIRTLRGDLSDFSVNG